MSERQVTNYCVQCELRARREDSLHEAIRILAVRFREVRNEVSNPWQASAINECLGMLLEMMREQGIEVDQ